MRCLISENDNVGPLRIDETDHWGGSALHLIVRAPFKVKFVSKKESLHLFKN